MNRRTGRMFEVACLAGLFMVLVVSQVSAGSTWNYNIVSDPALHGIHDGISGDYLVYAASIENAMDLNSTRVIQLYSLSTGNQTRIATAEPGSTLTGEGIDGNYVVWFSEPQADSAAVTPNRVVLYSIADKNQTTIRKSSGAGWPQVSGIRSRNS